MIRRKLTVSLTVRVVSGITSDVGKRSSVRSDGICQRKGKLVIQDCRLRKKRIKKKNRSSKILQLTSSSCTVNSAIIAIGTKFSGI